MKKDSLSEFHEVIKQLRGPTGCPWDRKQSHESLMPFAIEETAEFLDEVESKDDLKMKDELGDMLLQIVLHATIAEERGAFTLEDVIHAIHEKMVRRHPHVFGDEKITQVEEVLGVWQKVKQLEGAKPKSKIGRKPNHYPALLRVHEMTELAGKLGFDWPNAESVVDKIDEELAELKEAMLTDDEAHIDEELGDLLFVVANLARVRKRENAEKILQKSIRKFERRFGFIEAQLASLNRTFEDCSLVELDALWDRAKMFERASKKEEYFEIVDSKNDVIGQALRSACHGDPSLIHRSVHVVVFHPEKDSILLQKRSAQKDVQPNKWDTAVGGHLAVGENYETAARREMSEELGLPEHLPLIKLFDTQIRNSIESENIRTFACEYAGPFILQTSEVDEVRFFTRDELKTIVDLDDNSFTPNLKSELQQLLTSVKPLFEK